METMNCEEFELRGLDVDRADANPVEAAAAAQHAQTCARCSGLLGSWREVKSDLRLLREATQLDSATARVEMRLKQELRTRREARVPRRTVVIASWALAAVAVLATSVGWVRTKIIPITPVNVPTFSANTNDSNADGSETLLAADDDGGEFTQLPGSLPSEFGQDSILQVRIERGALERFGLPVDPDQAAEWVDVDFLVGEDGQPQAVRLHQDTLVAGVTQ